MSSPAQSTSSASDHGDFDDVKGADDLNYQPDMASQPTMAPQPAMPLQSITVAGLTRRQERRREKFRNMSPAEYKKYRDDRNAYQKNDRARKKREREAQIAAVDGIDQAANQDFSSSHPQSQYQQNPFRPTDPYAEAPYFQAPGSQQPRQPSHRSRSNSPATGPRRGGMGLGIGMDTPAQSIEGVPLPYWPSELRPGQTRRPDAAGSSMDTSAQSVGSIPAPFWPSEIPAGQARRVVGPVPTTNMGYGPQEPAGHILPDETIPFPHMYGSQVPVGQYYPPEPDLYTNMYGSQMPSGQPYPPGSGPIANMGYGFQNQGSQPGAQRRREDSPGGSRSGSKDRRGER